MDPRNGEVVRSLALSVEALTCRNDVDSVTLLYRNVMNVK
jgi:hypothetical protein